MTLLTSSVEQLLDHFVQVRQFTEQLVRPLSAEDCVIQSMPDVSPTRWHLAHTTWFFETFVLQAVGAYEVFDPDYNYLFNSYYNAIGKQFSRPQRGLLSRPGLEQILRYRQYVDGHVQDLLMSGELRDDIAHAMEIGLHHEQQHQELILTDIKHVLSIHPACPAYQDLPMSGVERVDADWVEFPAGLVDMGHAGGGFGYDNEFPRHRVFLHPYRLADSLVTCGQYLDFMADGGYQRPDLWLSLGWNLLQEQQQWQAPLYWVCRDGEWLQHTLAGLVPLEREWPVCHVSYFEADAFARWAGARLPTEFEWEHAAGQTDVVGQFCDDLFEAGLAVHPTQAGDGQTSMPARLFGGVWEWTSSSYAAYPGYRAPPGALGEYNGKFMCNQYVLRGGSVATSNSHIRATYRNFFPPDARWQFSGIRLAQ